MKKYSVIVCIIFFSFVILYTNVYATENLKTYTYKNEETLKSSDRMINFTTYTFCKPSSTYDFIDEDGLFNNVYVSDNNVYWSKYDSSMTRIFNKKWPLFYNINTEENSGDQYKILSYNFGNAIYYNGNLYVMYSRYTSRGLTKDQYKEEKAMAMIKYDKNGNAVATREYKTVELSNSYGVDDINYTTCAPFYNSNCSLAVNDGVIACFYGRNIYMSHQTSALMFIDPNSLEIVSNLQNRSLDSFNRAKYYAPYGHNISHSLGQRIISTSDGQFLMMESGDAGTYGSTRGLMLTKLYNEYDEKVSQSVVKKSTKKMVHYSEGSTGSNGYNCTYSVLGNIIELNSGYMYIGGLDKNINLAYGSGIDSPWNVFVQKYNKKFYNMDTQEKMQLLKNTSIRKTIGEKPTNTSYGRLYLNGDEQDFGIKWLTDLDYTKTTILVRAVKAQHDNIVILWEENGLEKNDYGGYYVKSSERTSHYMIIDKDGNTIVEDTLLDNVTLTDEEQYVYKEGKVYWTTTSGKNVNVNVLDVSDAIKVDYIKGDYNEDGEVDITDAYLLLRSIALETKLSDYIVKIVDMDDSSDIDITDAYLLLRTVVKNM